MFKGGCSKYPACIDLFPESTIRDNPAAAREQTFAALAPNAIAMIRNTLQSNGIETKRINSVVILGCGSGHSARGFAHLFQADVYGIEKEQDLVDCWDHAKELLDSQQQTRSVTKRIRLEQGDILHASDTLTQKLKRADLVFCWNSRLLHETNVEMFTLCDEHLPKTAVLVCTLLAPVHMNLTLHDSMRICHTDLDPNTSYCFTMGNGTIGGDGFLFYTRRADQLSFLMYDNGRWYGKACGKGQQLEQLGYRNFVKPSFGVADNGAFLSKCRSSRGKLQPIPDGGARSALATARCGAAKGAVELTTNHIEDTVAQPCVAAFVPVVKYQQGGDPTCVISSAASAVHAFGDERAAAMLAAHSQESIKHADRMDYLNHTVAKELKGWKVSGALTGDVAALFDALVTKSPYPTCIRIQGSDGSTSHCITTLGDWIFDSNETHALPLCPESLDRCTTCEMRKAAFVGCVKVLRLEPSKRLQSILGKRKARVCYLLESFYSNRKFIKIEGFEPPCCSHLLQHHFFFSVASTTCMTAFSLLLSTIAAPLPLRCCFHLMKHRCMHHLCCSHLLKHRCVCSAASTCCSTTSSYLLLSPATAPQ